MKFPKTIKILDRIYKVKFEDKPSDVDHKKRDSLWGQIDYWTRTITVYKSTRTKQDLWHTLIHEIIHGVSQQLRLKLSEDTVERLSTGLLSTLFDNKLLDIEN